MKRYIRSAEGLTTRERQKIAKTSTDPTELAQLANDKNQNIRRRVAENPNTPADVLAQLAHDEDKTVGWEVARNQNTPVDVLVQLANNDSMRMRGYVATNQNTPVDVLEQLANDVDEDVRRRVAQNRNTPEDVLAQLANDDNKDVRRSAVNNPNCPTSSKYSNKLTKSNDWPSADEWYNIESDEEFEDMWSRYLAGPEDEVNEQLQIYPEPSVQGGMGSMIIFDGSRNEDDAIFADFQDWCDSEVSMAAESKNANEYKKKYKVFVEEWISENWGRNKI